MAARASSWEPYALITSTTAAGQRLRTSARSSIPERPPGIRTSVTTYSAGSRSIWTSASSTLPTAVTSHDCLRR